MAVVNSVKDSRWLQLEVCREYQRNKCSRPDGDCKFAHPPPHVEVQNGRVIACYDSIKGRCNREKPPCKYFHPPQHLKDQLLINGRNHLALKNALMQQLPLQPLLQPPQLAPPTPAVVSIINAASSPYMAFSPYLSPSPMMGMMPADALAPPQIVPPVATLKIPQTPRTDRLEVCREWQRGDCKRAECRFAHPPEHVASAEGMVTLCMDFVKGRCARELCRYFHPTTHQLKSTAFPGVSPYSKRPAMDKSGLPVYQPSTAAYQQALAMQVQQPFVPVSSFYNYEMRHTTPTQPSVVRYMSPFSGDWSSSYCCTKILE